MEQLTKGWGCMVQQTAVKMSGTSELRRLGAGETFNGVFIISGITKKKDKNGRTYWDVTVSDEHGAIPAKVWSDAGWSNRSTPELEARPDFLSESQIAALRGNVVRISGKTVDFRGQVQFNFSAISLLDQERFPPSDYMARSDVPLTDLLKRLDSLVESCRPEIRDFLKRYFNGPQGAVFKEVPAAVSFHHAYAHGLLEHTLSVAESAKGTAEFYAGIYPSLDVDIVVAGALLHDIGKTESYTISPVPEMTLRGAVLDHIILGHSAFVKLAEDAGLSPETTLCLGHILISHHGQKEYGSPVVPATLEAMIVSSADELDFRMFCWKNATAELPPGQNISEYDYRTQRRFWRTGGSPGEAGA
jgi:3'-5' exoribonuclease